MPVVLRILKVNSIESSLTAAIKFSGGVITRPIKKDNFNFKESDNTWF